MTASGPVLAASAPIPGVTAGPVVQTSAAASPWPSVQRAPDAPSPAPTIQREGGVGSAVGGSTGAHAGTGGGRGHSEKELEELSQMLFSRIRSRLRADLIHDREAKGLTFDNV
jgi:hypothetical protein